MPDTDDARPRDDDPDDDPDLARAEEIYEEVEADEEDPVTRREVIEGELEDEGLSDEGEALGEHIE